MHGGLGGLGAGGRAGANTHRPLDHQALGNATGPVNRSFHGWSFRKDREPGLEASWARARKTPLPYDASELLRIVNRNTTTSPSAPSSSRKGGKGTVSEQYNSLRSPHQRALIDGLLEAVKGEERNPNAEWSLACIEQEVAEYIRKGYGKVREVREMRVVLRRGPRRDVPAAAAPTGDGLPGEIVDLINGHGQGPHRPSQPLQQQQQQQPMGMAMGMGRGAAPGGGPPFGGAGGGGGAAGPGPGAFAAGGAPGGFAGGQGGGGFGRGAAMNHGGGGGPFGGGGGGGGGGNFGGGGGGGGLHGMGGGVPNISMVPPPPPPPPPVGPPKGGFGGHGPAGHGPHGGQKAGKISKSPRVMPESDFDDLDDDDMDSLPEPVYSKPHKPPKGKKGVSIPRPPFPPSRSHSREKGGKSPKSREPELHRVPTIINNIKIPREKKGGHSRKTHSQPKYYPSSSDDDHYTLTPRSSDDETWSTSPSSMSGSSPGRYRQSRSRERYDYRPIRTTRDHKKPAPQPRPILRDPRPPVGYPVDAEGYYENGGYDALERRGYDRHEEPWRHHGAHRALPEKDYMAYSSPRRGYHERSRERERARLPPAPEVSTYDAPWRRAAAARRMEEEELVEREQAAQAELEMHMRRERVRNLEAATDEARGRRYGRRGDWW
ncbi:hypothetical protein SLS55_001856 [Diplodia seriata]|uniref:Uncharacterized protein n=1 Tax=Diplodia seriata TaxID=420778 RepID=A0ABR3CQI1_9PEZI